MSNIIYTKEFPSRLEAMTEVIEEAMQAAVSHGLIEEEGKQFFHLCLEEGLVNAIQHGNNCNGSRKVRVELAKEDEGDRGAIRICDEGRGFDLEAVPSPDCHTLGGRGLCLIKHFMEDVRYDKEKSCLQMSFKRNCFAKGV